MDEFSDSSCDSLDISMNYGVRLMQQNYFNQRTITTLHPQELIYKKAFKNTLESFGEFEKFAKKDSIKLCFKRMEYSLVELPCVKIESLRTVLLPIEIPKNEDKWQIFCHAKYFDDDLVKGLSSLFKNLIEFVMLQELEQEYVVRCFLQKFYVTFRRVQSEKEKIQLEDTEPSFSSTYNSNENNILRKNSLSYVCGYVAKKLKQMNLENKATILRNLIADEDSLEKENEKLICKLSRGGLTRLTERGYNLFFKIDKLASQELNSLATLSTKKETIIEKLIKDEEIIGLWNVLSMNSKDFVRVIVLFLRIKGKAIAANVTEKHQVNTKKASKSSKGLRPTLRALTQKNV